MGNILDRSMSSKLASQHCGLLDSGYEDEGASSAVERYVPPAPVGLGTHELQDGTIKSNFAVTPQCSRVEKRPETRRPSNARTEQVTNYVCLAAWTLLVVTTLVLGFMMHFIVMARVEDIEFSVGDQSRVTTWLSSLFCRNIHITSNQSFSAHRIEGWSDPTNVSHMKYNIVYPHRRVGGGASIYDHFRLISGTTLQLSVCSTRTRVEMYIIQSEANFELWQTDHSCTDCYLIYSPIHMTHGVCDDDHQQVFNLIVNETSNYAIVFHNPWAAQPENIVTITMHITMERMMYTTPPGQYSCGPGRYCIMPLSVFARESVMVEYLAYDTRYSMTHVMVSCEPRELMYLLVFFAFPLALGLSVIVLLGQCAAHCCQRASPPDSSSNTCVLSLTSDLINRRNVVCGSVDVADLAFEATTSWSTDIPAVLDHI